jgi:hypothetical protein
MSDWYRARRVARRIGRAYAGDEAYRLGLLPAVGALGIWAQVAVCHALGVGLQLTVLAPG